MSVPAMNELRRRSLLTSRKFEQPSEGRELNRLNGADSESHVASQLVKACAGEIRWGSREEDNSKIDHILSCTHPWYEGERMLVLCQTKSGKTYGKCVLGGAKIKARAIEETRKTTHSICLLWVDRKSGKGFWTYISPNTKTATQTLAELHEISPTTLFDLARQYSVDRLVKSGGNGITIPGVIHDFQESRRSARKIYSNLKTVASPTFGVIEITRIGWRDMLKKSRAVARKKSSLEVIPYLKILLSRKPSSYVIENSEYWKAGDFSYRSLEYLLRYDDARVNNASLGCQTTKTQVLVRIIEEIRYPTDWARRAMLSQMIHRRVVLKSAYHK